MQLPPLISFLLARRFEPFEIFLIDGRILKITHPESATIYHGGLGIWVTLRTGQLEFVDGDAVTSFRSSGVVEPSDFFQE